MTVIHWEGIKQSVSIVQRALKLTALQIVLQGDSVERAIVFTRTKHGANALLRKLEHAGIPAVAIHGNKTQNARPKAFESFRRKQVAVLVATDVAARGIDIAGVTHVINYDMPIEAENYVHRIGRTGRAGAVGTAVSFCTADERGELRAIEKLLGKKLTIENATVDSSRFESSTTKAHVTPKASRAERFRSRKLKGIRQDRHRPGQIAKSREAPGTKRYTATVG